MEKRRSNVFATGLVIGLILGLWFGVNIGKGQPFYSNPFSKKKIEKAIKRSGEKIIEKSGEALEETGKALKDKVTKE